MGGEGGVNSLNGIGGVRRREGEREGLGDRTRGQDQVVVVVALRAGLSPLSLSLHRRTH